MWFCLYLAPGCHKSPSHFRNISWPPVEQKVELCTSATVFKYWERTPSYLSNLFMLSLSNCSTRLQMALDIPFRRTNKGQKKVFLDPKIWNKFKNKNSCNYCFFHAWFEKRNSWGITIVNKFIDFVDHKLFSFTIFLCFCTSRETLMEIRNILELCLVHPCHLWFTCIFCL